MLLHCRYLTFFNCLSFLLWSKSGVFIVDIHSISFGSSASATCKAPDILHLIEFLRLKCTVSARSINKWMLICNILIAIYVLNLKQVEKSLKSKLTCAYSVILGWGQIYIMWKLTRPQKEMFGVPASISPTMWVRLSFTYMPLHFWVLAFST